MARSHARIVSAIWKDPDWRSLSMPAQWLYMVLLSQPRLNLAGCLDRMPQRWATLARDVPEYEITVALTELLDRRYVVVDDLTDELIIRSFTANDLTYGPLNTNLVKGFWSAWEGIMSTELRHLVVLNLPEIVWVKSGEDVPAEAEQMRRSGRLEPELLARLEPENPVRLEPPDPLPLPDPATAATADVLTVATRLLAERECDRRGTDIANREGYIRSRLAGIRRDHEADWQRRLEANPNLTAEQLIQLPQRSSRPADPTEATAAAAEARYQATQERMRGEACETCDGSHVVETDAGCVQCPSCTAPAPHLKLA